MSMTILMSMYLLLPTTLKLIVISSLGCPPTAMLSPPRNRSIHLLILQPVLNTADRVPVRDPAILGCLVILFPPPTLMIWVLFTLLVITGGLTLGILLSPLAYVL